MAKEMAKEGDVKVLINDKEIEIDYTSLHLDHVQDLQESVAMFEVSRDVSVKKGDKVKIYYKDSLELDGCVAKITKNIKLIKVVASTIKEEDLPKEKIGFTFVNNWKSGAVIVLAFVANKQVGVGIILFNFGLYLSKKLVANKKGQK